jgi:DNA-binding NarL/FixJ family response regulator
MRKKETIKTILVGKNLLVREGLSAILRQANFRILASVSCANELPVSAVQPNQMVFLIVHTGGDFGPALQQLKLLKERHPGGRIAIVDAQYRLGDIASAFRAGANGYLVHETPSDVLLKSIELVMMGEAIFPQAFLSYVLGTETGQAREPVNEGEYKPETVVTADDALAKLSSREKTILRHLVQGESNKAIARKIDIAEATVKVHIKAILRKVRVQNRTQAAIWAMNNGARQH